MSETTSKPMNAKQRANKIAKLTDRLFLQAEKAMTAAQNAQATARELADLVVQVETKSAENGKVE